MVGNVHSERIFSHGNAPNPLLVNNMKLIVSETPGRLLEKQI